MRPFIGDAFTDAEFADLIARAYAGFGHDARAPLKQLQPNHFLLELFHGPTLAFKDFAMQLIGQLFEAALARRGERVTIVGATSRRHRLGRDGGVSRARRVSMSSSSTPMAACRRCSAAR
jgi:hypothetical protein